jgi:digalactosyldiacylglycerol synthase
MLVEILHLVRLVSRYNHVLTFHSCLFVAQFSSYKRSILASGDISEFIPKEEADVAVLEEPEHLTWYYHGKRWSDKFQHVVGIVHTNYLEYVKREKNGVVQAFLLEHINNWMIRAYCNKVLLHSAAAVALILGASLPFLLILN